MKMGTFVRCLAVSLLAVSVWAVAAQIPAPAEQAPPATPEAAPPGKPGPATQLATRTITLKVGRGELIQFTDTTSRVSVSEPTIADAVVVSPYEVVVNGKAPGNKIG